MTTMNTTSMETFVDEKFLLHQIKFWLLLSLQIPAILLSLITFIFFIIHRAVLRSPKNQILSILLVVNFIQLSFDLPLPLHFYRLGYVSPATPKFCSFWTFFEFTLYATSEFLVATMSIQRHMLIFNGHVLRIRWKRFIFYILPLVFCLIYPITFYTCAIIFYPCNESPWDYRNNLCGFTGCYLMYNKVLGTYDWAANNGFPMVIDALSNVLLVARVIIQKRRRQQSMSWRQQRHMTKQLFCISILYMIGWGPCLVVGVYQIFVDPTFLADIQSGYFLDLIYGVCLFLPWMCLGLIPELKRWIKKFFHCHRRRNVVGTTLHTKHIETAL